MIRTEALRFLSYLPRKQHHLCSSIFERALIRERQMEGIALSKKKGLYKGRKKSLSEEQIQELQSRVSAGERKSRIARDLKISRVTLYKYLREGGGLLGRS